MGPTPPPYNPNVPRKSNTTTIVLIVLGICAVCCVLGVVGFGALGFWGFNKAKNFAACTVGVTEVVKAINQYADEHDGKLPDAAKWQDEVRPYFAALAREHSQKIKFVGTFDPNGMWGCKDETGPGMTGLAFNDEISGKKLSDIKDKDTRIMLFEVEKPGMNLHEPYRDLPMESSPKIMNSPRGWIKVTVNGEVISKGPNSRFGAKD